MRKYFFLGLVIAAAAALTGCKTTAATTSSPSGFTYNGSTGKCLNAQKEEGRNPAHVATIQKTKNCECTDLKDIDLVDLLPGITSENRFGYNELIGFNFRGADLNQASIHFNHLVGCDFSGAQMTTFDYGYTEITGQRDRYTLLPETGCAETDPRAINCRQ